MKKLKTILQSNKFYIVALLVLMFCLLVTLIPNYKSKYNGNETNFNCIIKDFSIDGNKLSLELSCDEDLVSNYYIKTLEEKKELESSLLVGSSISLEGELSSPSNNTVPYLFNYKKYLYYKKIYYILNVSKINEIKPSNNVFYKIKNLTLNRVRNIKNNEYIYAYILGNTDMLNVEVIDSYRTNGISHLFALSGLHVSIFSLILMKLLNKLKVNNLKKYVLVFIFLLFFSFISGFSPSILRASLLFFLLGINKIYNLEIKTINVLYIVFIILALINPFIIYNMSFILSFITTYFIILATDMLNGKNYIISLFKVSLLSFITNIGLSLYYFNYINPLGVLLNLLFVPLVTFLVFPLTLITFVFPFFSGILGLLTGIMEWLSINLSKFSLTVYFPQISLFLVFLYYIFLFILIKFKNKKIIICMLILLIFWKYQYLFNFSTNVYFIDVGQGDSALIVTPHNKKVIMIDTGGKINYEVDEWKKRKKTYSISNDTLIPFMRKLGIEKIDYLFLSHGDADHAKEAVSLINNFRVDNVYINKGSENSIEKSIKNKKVLDSEYLKIDNIEINSLNNQVFNNENDDSLVFLMNVDSTKIMFMGDASVKTEESILKNYNLPAVDILKVGHHGSITSSGKEFIKKIMPKYSIISVGKNNRYNHPSNNVLETLKNSSIYRTDYNGSIMFKIKNNELVIKTYAP